jgi:hypothetical protein
MTSEQPLQTQAADLDTLADALSTALTAHPGVVRLEPTLRSVINRWTPAAIDDLQKTLRPAAQPSSVTRDGLILSLTDTGLNLQIDLATDIRQSALELARQAQALAARLIEATGLTIGYINVTILAIEETSRP